MAFGFLQKIKVFFGLKKAEEWKCIARIGQKSIFRDGDKVTYEFNSQYYVWISTYGNKKCTWESEDPTNFKYSYKTTDFYIRHISSFLNGIYPLDTFIDIVENYANVVTFHENKVYIHEQSKDPETYKVKPEKSAKLYAIEGGKIKEVENKEKDK